MLDALTSPWSTVRLCSPAQDKSDSGIRIRFAFDDVSIALYTWTKLQRGIGMNFSSSQLFWRILVLVVVVGCLWYLSSNGLLNLGGSTTQPSQPPISEPPIDEPPVTEAPGTVGRAGDFDFYVLALSWSPQFCSSNNDPQQCSIGRRLAFVLHGLWPQYNRGYPSDCSNEQLPTAVRAQFVSIYPSPSLIDHEWSKHGTCSGLAPADFLALSKRIRDSVVIPATYRAPDQPVRVTTSQLKTDFVNSNPGMTADTVAPFCTGSGLYLQELQVCFSKEGKPMACSSEILRNSSRSCQAASYLMRNVR
jgi:ribonuclease T2